METRLSSALADGPDPAASLARAHEVLAAARSEQPELLARVQRERPQALVVVLQALCATAPFFAGRLRRQPGLLLELAGNDLDAQRTLEELEARLDVALARVETEERAEALRSFKYAELARITVREADPERIPEERVAEPLAELSWLAEAILGRALEETARAIAAEAGPPRWMGADGSDVALSFSVLGLGKLGGEELNYSSDVDLIYVYQSPPPQAEPLVVPPDGLPPVEYFTRLASRFGRLVGANTSEGFLYRVDLDLRPEGSLGPLVCSSDALASYYDGWAATWEKAAFMKARPVAGDRGFGWQVARSIDPMIYQSSMDLAGAASIREMKARIEAEHAGDPDRFHVKLGAGGIRDVEFVAQTFQLLHGGRIPQVRGRSAPGALDALAEVGMISIEMRDELLRAYRFLRRLENRLQMEDERQIHQLPPAGPARERLARSLYPGETAVARLEDRLREETERVRAHFEGLLASGDAGWVVDLINRAAPQLLRPGPGRQLLEDLAGRLASAVSESADPERAMNNLARFVEGVGAHSFYYGLLVDRPELVARLIGLFASSRYLSNVVARLPQLIEPLFADAAHLLPSREELESALLALRAEQGLDEEEAGLAALRLFQQRELVNVGLLDLAGTIDLDAVEAALTQLAEVCLSAALELACAQLERSRPEAAVHVGAGDFLVVGMGKLGSRELGYGSDLDVIFLYDAPGIAGPEQMEAQDAFVRLAQKLGWALQTPTAEGVCYEVDARLRPSGNQGMLVTSFSGFERYHAESAMVWERQALLRARPVAGSAVLGKRFAALRDEILRKPLPEDLREQVHHVRTRMEQELAQERPGQRNLKTGRGGVLDVESIVQLLQLQHGGVHPELLKAQPVATLLQRIQDAGLLPAESVATLHEGWEFLRRLSSRLRIVENRSITDLREDRSDLDSVARSLGYAASARTGTSRLPLLDEYTRRTESIRSLYTRLVDG